MSKRRHVQVMIDALESWTEFENERDLISAAYDWVEYDFAADAAAEWWAVGLWEPSIAAHLAEAGVTPREAAAAAAAIVEREEIMGLPDGQELAAAVDGRIGTIQLIREVERARQKTA